MAWLWEFDDPVLDACFDENSWNKLNLGFCLHVASNMAFSFGKNILQLRSAYYHCNYLFTVTKEAPLLNHVIIHKDIENNNYLWSSNLIIRSSQDVAGVATFKSSILNIPYPIVFLVGVVEQFNCWSSHILRLRLSYALFLVISDKLIMFRLSKYIKEIVL